EIGWRMLQHTVLRHAEANGPAPSRRNVREVADLDRELNLARRAGGTVVFQLSHLHPPNVVLRERVRFVSDRIRNGEHSRQTARAGEFNARTFSQRNGVAELAGAHAVGRGDVVRVSIDGTIDRAIDKVCVVAGRLSDQYFITGAGAAIDVVSSDR